MACADVGFWLYRSSWPAAYWDDWMRLGQVQQGRQSIRPEVCRTYNFGEKGSSHGQYYRRFLKPIKLNDEDVDWSSQDLTYLEPARYSAWWNNTIAEARLVTSIGEIAGQEGSVKLVYASQQEYENLADQLGMIKDWKDGTPRASYQGIVHINFAGVRCILIPLSACSPLRIWYS